MTRTLVIRALRNTSANRLLAGLAGQVRITSCHGQRCFLCSNSCALPVARVVFSQYPLFPVPSGPTSPLVSSYQSVVPGGHAFRSIPPRQRTRKHIVRQALRPPVQSPSRVHIHTHAMSHYSSAKRTKIEAPAHRYPGARNPSHQRVLVTGARGKVGIRVVQAFHEANGNRPWEVVATDMVRGVFDTPGSGDPWNYQQADLTDAGEVFSMVARFQPDCIVHIAAIPDIEHNAPHTVFANNTIATFNVVEACVALGVPRLINISSEQAPGFFSNGGPPGHAVCTPKYYPVDEEHPMFPNNPYALSKSFGEQICDAAVRRTGGALAIISIRPSWCQDERNVERNLGPLIRDHSIPQEGLWSYIDIYDLASAIVMASVAATTGHEVLYIAAADNIGGRDMAKAMLAQYGDDVPLKGKLARLDASGISCAKAKRLIGWEPKRTWRDYLDEQGKALPIVEAATKGRL